MKGNVLELWSGVRDGRGRDRPDATAIEEGRQLLFGEADATSPNTNPKMWDLPAGNELVKRACRNPDSCRSLTYIEHCGTNLLAAARDPLAPRVEGLRGLRGPHARRAYRGVAS